MGSFCWEDECQLHNVKYIMGSSGWKKSKDYLFRREEIMRAAGIEPWLQFNSSKLICFVFWVIYVLWFIFFLMTLRANCTLRWTCYLRLNHFLFHTAAVNPSLSLLWFAERSASTITSWASMTICPVVLAKQLSNLITFRRCLSDDRFSFCCWFSSLDSQYLARMSLDIGLLRLKNYNFCDEYIKNKKVS